MKYIRIKRQTIKTETGYITTIYKINFLNIKTIILTYLMEGTLKIKRFPIFNTNNTEHGKITYWNEYKQIILKDHRQ